METGEGPFHVVMIVATLTVSILSTYGLHACKITVAPAQLLAKAALLTTLLIGAAFYRWRKAERLVNVSMITFWALTMGNLYVPPMCMAARRKVELSDPLLARIDCALGVEVPDILRIIRHYPAVGRFLELSYTTLVFLMIVAIIVPPLLGDMRRAKEYTLACMVAAMIAIPVFSGFQAVGPWSYYHYPPTADQERCMRTLFDLKSDGSFMLDLSNPEGVIACPSFHTILAVLSAAALWSTPYLRWWAAALALLIVTSTVTTGWHYVADVVAGLLVAAVSWAAARSYTRIESRMRRLPA